MATTGPPDVGWATASIQGEEIGNDPGPMTAPPASSEEKEENRSTANRSREGQINPKNKSRDKDNNRRKGRRERGEERREREVVEAQAPKAGKVTDGEVPEWRAQSRPRVDEGNRGITRRERELKEDKMRLDAVNRQISTREHQLRRERASCEAWRGDPIANGQMSATEILGRQIQGLWTSTRPSNDNLRMRREIVKDVEKWISTRHRWEGCGLEVEAFGSTKTGLLEVNSDMDLVLKDPMRPLGVGTPKKDYVPLAPGLRPDTLENPTIAGENAPKWNSVAHVARRLMSSRKYTDVIPVTRAKVPIVKFVHASSGLVMDLNINDRFGEANSQLIAAYADIRSDLVRPLLFVVKRWFSRRGLNNPSPDRGPRSLNSYTICLIALQFLQVKGYLPNLQSPALLKELGTPNSILWQRAMTDNNRRRDRRRAKEDGGRGGSDPNKKGKSEPIDEVPNAEGVDEGTMLIEAAEESTAPDDTATDMAGMPNDDQAELGIQVDPETGARGFDTTFATLATPQQLELAMPTSTNVRDTLPFDPKRDIEASLDHQLGSLLQDFFVWLANVDFDRYGFSLKNGAPFLLQRALAANGKSEISTQPHHWQDEPIVCQDPFIVDRNTAGGVISEVKGILVSEVKQAVKALEGPKADLPLLCDLCGDEKLYELKSEERALKSKVDEARQKLDKLSSKSSHDRAPIDAPRGPKATAKDNDGQHKARNGRSSQNKGKSAKSAEGGRSGNSDNARAQGKREEIGQKVPKDDHKQATNGQTRREAIEKSIARAQPRGSRSTTGPARNGETTKGATEGTT